MSTHKEINCKCVSSISATRGIILWEPSLASPVCRYNYIHVTGRDAAVCDKDVSLALKFLENILNKEAETQDCCIIN
jgi:hypothetical protein